MPDLLRPAGPPPVPPAPVDIVKKGLEKIEEVKQFFRQARAYLQETSHGETNLKFEALRPLFEKKQKFFIRCDIVRQILVAIDFVKEFGFNVVLIGASECYQV